MWIVFAVFFLYFLPFFVGLFRSHPYPVLLFGLNASLGWTGWGWVVSFVYALWTFVEREPIVVAQAEPPEEPSDDDPERFSMTELRRLERLRSKGRGHVILFPVAKVSSGNGR